MGRNVKAFSTCDHASISDVAVNLLPLKAAGKHLRGHD